MILDPQSTPETKRYPIAAVGVTRVVYPSKIRDHKSERVQQVAAEWRMSVALPGEKRGTHMSRFIDELQKNHNQEMGCVEFGRFSEQVVRRLEADEAQLSAEFTWFREVKAPVSGQTSIQDYRISFGAHTSLDGDGIAQTKTTLGLLVPAKSLCPCSKAISDRGAHNQRSYIDVRITVPVKEFATVVPGIDELIAILEGSASSPLYPLLKREDEKFVTEHAYDNPVFVETLVRNVADRLQAISGLIDVGKIRIEAVNQESIHAHDCFAVLNLGKGE